MSAPDPRGRRVFVGDIQGCLDELERLLAAVDFDSTRDSLQPVGDVVNRGPDSLGVLRLLRSLGAGGVLGNHDLHLLRAAAGLRDISPRDTFGDVLGAPDRDELLAWLAERPFVRTFDDVILVHAGLNPTWSDPGAVLADRDPLSPSPEVDFATRVRYCTETGEKPEGDWPPPEAPFAPWFEHWLATGDRRTVVFGHWARMGLVHREGLRGLDTGCVWGKRLTAWVAEEDRLVHVDAARTYSKPSAE